jgi:hypothetical protein
VVVVKSLLFEQCDWIIVRLDDGLGVISSELCVTSFLGFCGFNFGGGGGGRTGRSNEFRGECELFLFTTTGSERFSDFVRYLDSDWLLPELVDREIFQCDFSLLSTSD